MMAAVAMCLLLLLPAACEQRLTCGGSYGFASEGPPCPDPTWEPAWALNLSTQISNVGTAKGWYDAAAAWGLVTITWSLHQDLWQNVHPHSGEEMMLEQCRRVKALNTGTKCMVYRQNELSLQWQKTSRDAQTVENADMYLQFKTKDLCDAAPPCNIAAFHQTGPAIIACNKSAPVEAPNCAYCCNFSSVYNEPIGGQWPHGSKPAAGDNALGDGQLFFDFRNPKTKQFWVEKVMLGGVSNDWIDGVFCDDPAGFGQEHNQIQSAVQLTAQEVSALQVGTQEAWNEALALFVPKGKYMWNSFRSTQPGPSVSDKNACANWMREQCARPANESAMFYPRPSTTSISAANISIASFLVTRGPYSYISADQATIEGQDRSNPFFAIFHLDVGKPLEACKESPVAVFSRQWSGGHASVDCSIDVPVGMLDFRSLLQGRFDMYV